MHLQGMHLKEQVMYIPNQVWVHVTHSGALLCSSCFDSVEALMSSVPASQLAR